MSWLTRHAGTVCAAAILALAALFTACGGVPEGMPTHKLQRAQFFVTQIESGEIQAASGDVIMSPRIGGSLKILYLYPEGGQVDVGDLVLQFDPSDFEKSMLDREGQLEEATMDYSKSKAQRDQKLADLRRTIQRQEAQSRLAQLNFQRTELESPVERERARIELEKAERSMKEARQDSIAQEVVNRVDMMGQQRRIDSRQERFDEAERDYGRTSVFATRPGIVVYRKIWKRGTDEQTKVTVGDEVWGGRALMDIPDLSDMQVLCLIGEMDIKQMSIGQRALIRLDAFPGPVFHGEVVSLAPMASPQPGAPDIHVFEMALNIDEQDDRLRPGMSAEVEVILQTLEEVLSVPLDAVFRVDGKDIVYRKDGRSLDPVEVQLGPRNAISVVIESGLAEGDEIALRDPASI
jgi:HlyD family secretion protein